MHEWFRWDQAQVPDRTILIFRLSTLSGQPAEQETDFVDQLAQHIVGYAIQGNVEISDVFLNRYRVTGAEAARLDRESVARLLDRNANGDYIVLQGFVGECLAHWAFRAFWPPVAISEPVFGSTEPAFDLVAVTLVNGEVRTRLIQAKATGGYASANCHLAVDKFHHLHNGREYLFQLASKMRLMAVRPGVTTALAGRDWRDVLLAPDLRDYAIFVAYDGDAPEREGTTWGREWARSIPGGPERRLLITLALSRCDSLIEHLVRRLEPYARPA